ncbi:CST complex subunit CTC1 isoform X1 [Fundulus heteroclitus]|uniref:CST complex subunit CTC1 isoform X1 n=1 Tax=Fundulus heteroclitus TaxID=8078 RepID=UPI00165C3206|nr:CST complex subunit CTC1 isoform X1 [Fundulus heteroclitus]
MDSLQEFLDRFGPSSEAESIWLKNFFTFVQEHLSAAACGSAPSAAHQSPAGASCDHRVEQLSVSAVEKIQEKSCLTCGLPVSYRPLSVSELLSQQHLACVSNLSWSTNQHRAWLREAELSLPGQRALPRVNLLLIGWLREGRGGEWRLMDDSGNVRCEMVCPSPLWMNRPVFLPHWNYIPHDALGQDQDRGYLEVIGSPVLLCPRAEQGLAASVGGAGLDGAVSVREAAGVLRNRVRGQRVSVWGQVDSVCPLLDVSGSSFFFFSLRDDDHTVPVLVKDIRLWWSRCVCVGLSVCVTALRVCSLRGWRGNNVLTVTHRSQLHTGYTQQHNIQLHNTHTHPDNTQPDNTQQHTEQHSDSTHEAEPVPLTPADHAHSDHHLLMDHEGAEPEEAGPEGAEHEEDPVQPAVRIKQSRVISYQGVVTEVVSEGAGLYLMDRKVGLCLAYQPPERRRLRAGDQVELHHVHFLYRPCPDLPPSMLCCCLRSSLRVTAFSRVGGASEDPRCPADGVLPRLLLQHIRGMDQYLWTCHLTSQLAHSLVPVELHHHPPPPPPPLPQCVCLLSWKLSETLWTRRQPGPRDIYSEMLDHPHRCPLNQYQVDPSVPQLLSVSDLLQSLRSSCWSSVSLRSLLPQDGSSLSRSEVNSSLSWSCRTLSSDPQTGDSLRPRPLLLVGVLQLPSERSEFRQTLQLRDATAAVGCVVTETTEDGGQRASFNTAWIGCLVCVRRFSMVTERFLQSEFPSYQHLDQDRFITHRTCRVYLQFCLDHLVILSPSATMAAHLRRQGEESGEEAQRGEEEEEDDDDDDGDDDGMKKRRRDEEVSSSVTIATHLRRQGEESGGEEEEDDDDGMKKRRRDEDVFSCVTMTTVPGGGASHACVSMVIKVRSKGGVAWSNAGIRTNDGREAGLELGFSVTALVIGPVFSWGRDPKNQPMTEKEAEPEREVEVLLLFSGGSARWFPVLQPGCFYRVTAANAQDPSVLIGCRVRGQSGVEVHSDSTIQVGSDWRFHTLTRPLLLRHTWTQTPPPSVLSVSQVLDCSSEVVTFQGLISERRSLMDGKGQSKDRHSGVRLTVCDQSGRSLCVYLDLSHAPYPPGLLPGNQVLLSGLLRKLSRSGGVYCSLSPVSCVTVTALGDSCRLSPPPPSPSMHLAQWAASRCVQGQVRGHVVGFLFLQLQWSCSLCGSVYRQVCSSQCGSSSAVFQSSAKLVIDDATAEAHVWLSGKPVQTVLGLADSQWEGLQRALRVRGHIRVFPRGRSLGTEGDSEDVLLHFLLSLCSSDVISQQVSLTCRKLANQSSEEVRRFSRGDRDFLTRMPRPLQLTCVYLETP